MLRKKLKYDEAGTLGLPIRIVVLTVVGLIGFYAVLSALSNAPTPPKPMYATANLSTLSLPSTEGVNKETNLSLPVKVFDSENRGIGDANVIAWSPDRKKAYSGVTDIEGNVILKISNPELPPGKAEGYIKIKVMREGYRDFTSDYFLKVIQG